MANAGGLKIIGATIGDLYVTLTNAAGTTPTTFSDINATVSLTTPILVPQNTTQFIYLGSGSGLTLSVNYGAQNGPQIADPRQGSTLGVDLQIGEIGVYDYSSVNGYLGLQNLVGPVSTTTQIGLLGQSFDISTTQAGSLLTSGVLNMFKVFAGAGQAVTNIEYGVQTAGATLTAGQNLVGLYSSPVAGVCTLIGTAADQSTPFTVLGSHKAPLTVVAGQSLVALPNKQFYIGVLSVGTTPVSLYRGATPAAAANYNTSIAANNARAFTTGSALTALPATVTISTGTISVNGWVGLS